MLAAMHQAGRRRTAGRWSLGDVVPRPPRESKGASTRPCISHRPPLVVPSRGRRAECLDQAHALGGADRRSLSPSIASSRPPHDRRAPGRTGPRLSGHSVGWRRLEPRRCRSATARASRATSPSRSSVPDGPRRASRGLSFGLPPSPLACSSPSQSWLATISCIVTCSFGFAEIPLGPTLILRPALIAASIPGCSASMSMRRSSGSAGSSAAASIPRTLPSIGYQPFLTHKGAAFSGARTFRHRRRGGGDARG